MVNLLKARVSTAEEDLEALCVEDECVDELTAERASLIVQFEQEKAGRDT